jgi:hypothetical protein
VEVSDNVFVIHPAFRNALKPTSSIEIPPYQPERGWRQQYAKVLRRRSAVRGSFESPRNISKELPHLIGRIERLRERLVTERGVPAEVSSEVSRSLNAIISELQGTSLIVSRLVELRIPMARATRYLRDLRANLEGNGYLTSKSLSYYIEDLIDEIDKILLMILETIPEQG